jgi:hypothetical protein
LCLGLGVLLGVWLLWRREVQGIWPAPYLITAHVHLILVGVVMELIFGIAWWFFPRPAKDDRRYRPWLAEAAWGMLTVGTCVRAGGELARPWVGSALLGWLIVVAGTSQALGLLAGVLALRPRVRAMGTGIRATGG